MIRFLESDLRLLPVLQKGGCAFLCPHWLLPDEISPEEANSRFQVFNQQGVISNDCTINAWSRFLAGVHSGQSVILYPFQFSRKVSDRSYPCAYNEKEILKWELRSLPQPDGTFENHFTVGDGRGNTAWDPENRPDVMALPTTVFVEKVIVLLG